MYFLAYDDKRMHHTYIQFICNDGTLKSQDLMPKFVISHVQPS